MGRPTLPVRLFFFLVGLLLLPCRPVLAQTTIEYYHLDALGSVRAVTNQQGQVIRTHDFQPFGEEENAAPVQTDVRLFNGKERDKETALDYFGARYYRGEIGRFTTVDPVYTWSENLADPQRWNRYAYVRNNPLRFVDPDGRIAVDPDDPAKAAGVILEDQKPGEAPQAPPQPKDAPKEAPSWDKSKPTPADPSGLGPAWERNPEHKHPYGEEYLNPNNPGEKIEWNKGRPGPWGPKSDRGKDGWHYTPPGGVRGPQVDPGSIVKSVGIVATIGAVMYTVYTTAPVWVPALLVF